MTWSVLALLKKQSVSTVKHIDISIVCSMYFHMNSFITFQRNLSRVIIDVSFHFNGQMNVKNPFQVMTTLKLTLYTFTYLIPR